VVWLADDVFDYPFQVDYARLWADAVDAFRLVVAHDPAIRVSLEPKPSDPRRFSLVRSTTDALLLVHEVALPNAGVTLDVCHSLMAGEHPPAAAALALRAGRLFGIHLNDGYGRADDGLAVASVNLPMTLELLWWLRRFDYRGTCHFDTFPLREDPVAECERNIQTVLALEAALDRLDETALAAAISTHDALAAREVVETALGWPRAVES
jgi:xylose isomerase